MMESLTVAWRQGQLSDLAFHFSKLIARLDPCAGEAVLLAAALVSQGSASGETCLNLNDVAGTSMFRGIHGVGFTAPKLSTWVSALRTSSVVGTFDMQRPLVLEADNRLYLYRFRNLEERIAVALRSRLNARDFIVDTSQMSHALNKVFPDWSISSEQRDAAMFAIRRPFTVIKGGPGSGKTSTVVYMLALMIELGLVTVNRVALSAPTGKATARLLEAVGQVSSQSVMAESWAPLQAMTLHRLLGWRTNGRSPKYGSKRRLPYDIVIIDEASMVSLELMTHLLESLHPDSRLVLLGDHNQLDPVDTGTVFSDICELSRFKIFSGSVVSLYKSWRFAKESHIGRLADLVTSGRLEDSLNLLADDKSPEVTLRTMSSNEDLTSLLEESCLDVYTERFEMMSKGVSEKEIFRDFSRMQILAAQRSGVAGVDTLNRIIRNRLSNRGLISTGESFYCGQPILISKNNYDLDLFNGDLGVLLLDAERAKLKAVFPRAEGECYFISPSRLPQHETAYAITIHKSQGSEFEHVIVALPPKASPVLSRMLLYTAITRATKKMEIWGTKEILRYTVGNDIRRGSGLQSRLRFS